MECWRWSGEHSDGRHQSWCAEPALFVERTRRYCCAELSHVTGSPTATNPPSSTWANAPPRQSGYMSARSPGTASSMRSHGFTSPATRTSVPSMRRAPKQKAPPSRRGLRTIERQSANVCALSRPDLPLTIALDEHVRESNLSVERLALSILAAHVVDARHHAGGSLHAHVELR
jgi:hypothetical protein